MMGGTGEGLGCGPGGAWTAPPPRLASKPIPFFPRLLRTGPWLKPCPPCQQKPPAPFLATLLAWLRAGARSRTTDQHKHGAGKLQP